MNETVVTAVALGLVAVIAALGAVLVVAAVVRAIRHRTSSIEDRAKRAITDLAVDRGRRQVWGTAALGAIAAGAEFTCGGGGSGVGCAGGGCGGGGCGGGCGG